MVTINPPHKMPSAKSGGASAIPVAVAPAKINQLARVTKFNMRS
jgi:hypothetical protein